MKIKENYLHDALKTDKNDKSNSKENVRRQPPAEHSDAANKLRQTNSPLKDEMKFASLLETPAKLPKLNQRQDSGDERRDDEKNDKKAEMREKDSAENLAGDSKTENYESAGGQAGGGQSGFGMQGQVGGLNLNENFAARSILHIADLERLISTVRTQTALGGRREVILQLKRSVLEGLSVRITTGEGARVQIEFLAANEKVRSQIESHAEELAGILRGRGVNLETLKTSVSTGDRENKNSSTDENAVAAAQNDSAAASDSDLSADNTFDSAPRGDGRIYNA